MSGKGQERLRQVGRQSQSRVPSWPLGDTSSSSEHTLVCCGPPPHRLPPPNQHEAFPRRLIYGRMRCSSGPPWSNIQSRRQAVKVLRKLWLGEPAVSVIVFISIQPQTEVTRPGLCCGPQKEKKFRVPTRWLAHRVFFFFAVQHERWTQARSAASDVLHTFSRTFFFYLIPLLSSPARGCRHRDFDGPRRLIQPYLPGCLPYLHREPGSQGHTITVCSVPGRIRGLTCGPASPAGGWPCKNGPRRELPRPTTRKSQREGCGTVLVVLRVGWWLRA